MNDFNISPVIATDPQLLNDWPLEPIFNGISFVHSPNNTDWVFGDIANHDGQPFEVGRYTSVIHDSRYLDLNGLIYFNPAPVFVPAPNSIMAFIAIAAGICLNRQFIHTRSRK